MKVELELDCNINFKDTAMKQYTTILSILIFCLASTYLWSQNDQSLKIYIDADFSNHLVSSESIERGLKVALSTNRYKLFNKPIEIIRMDHRGNSARSERHIKKYLKDNTAIAMVSGIHSPPLLAQRKFINENGVLFLVPWAAAGPITRYPSEKNSIFRLSIDDSKAGQVIVDFAIKKKKYKKPYLLLENTGWGNSNQKTMSSALKKLGINDYKIGRFNWGLKSTGAKSYIFAAHNAGCDVMILVANTIEGEVICKALTSTPNKSPLPLLSHWGIIGGDFHDKVPDAIRSKIDLHFIQTSFSFINTPLDEYQLNVFNKTKEIYPDIKHKRDILAPTGFIHAHDIGLLLIQAQKNVTYSKMNIQKVRDDLRFALENIDTPVRGLIKTYNKPFSKFSKDNIDAHEALNKNDFTMAKFGRDNEIILVR